VQVDPIALARAAAAEPQVAFTSRDTVIGLIQARHGWEVPGLLSWNGAVNAPRQTQRLTRFRNVL
jgi:hypothetical protein